MSRTELSYASGVSTTPLLGQTIGDRLDQAAAEYAAHDALVSVFEGRRFTYAELRDEVDRCARGLMALGVRKGDRVGVWSTNCIAWVLAQFATAKIGAVLVNINPAYRAGELEYALKQSQCGYLIAGERFKDEDYVPMLREILPELGDAARLTSASSVESSCAPKSDPARDLSAAKLPDLRRVIFLGDRAAATAGGAGGMLEWRALLSPDCYERTTPAALADRQASLDCDDVVNIQYTSGTTGFPKGAMLTHHNILNNGYFVGLRMGLTHADRLCIPVPFYHCFGMVMGNLACISHGATMVLPAPHFSPLHTLQAVAAERCTALHGVPTMFIAELDHPRFAEFDLSSLRTGIMAGAPCPEEVMKRVMTRMHCAEITIACGMTETSPVCNMTEVNDPIALRVGTVGRVMPHQEQKIVPPGSRSDAPPVPRGQPGELCYRGYHVMRGYYNNPEATRDTIDPAGWLHGGDLAVMDPAGYVRITGRLKDMIIRGGEKIFPREVEEFLFTHPHIAEAYVIGVPDPYYGEQVMAWIKLKDGRSLTEQEVCDFCRGKVQEYKVPRRVKFVTEFPTTVTGKVQKYRMREISAGEIGQAAGEKCG